MTKSTQNTHSRRFGGINRLYGMSAAERLAQAHIAVIGIGGVGSWSVEALARSGVGTLTLIDLDNVAESNVNRQLHALTENFGKPKVTALQERIMQINPDCIVNVIEDFVDLDNMSQIFHNQFDFVIDAMDQAKVKAALANYFVRNKQAFVLSGSAGGQRHPELIQTADLSKVTHDPLLANVRYSLRKNFGFSRDTAKKMKVACVYSTENITPPQVLESCDVQTAPQGLSCAGYGASMLVTATVGLHCAHAAIEHIVKEA